MPMSWMMLSETVVPVRISLVPIVSPLTAELFGVQFCLIPAASVGSVGSGS